MDCGFAVAGRPDLPEEGVRMFQEGSGVLGMSGRGVDGGGSAGGSEEMSLTGRWVGVVGR